MKNSHRYLQLCACLLMLCTFNIVAQETQPEVGLVDEVHGNVSRRLSDLIGQIDGFFGEEEAAGRINDSWARVRLDTSKREGDSVEVSGSVKLKVVLPRTEEKFRLLLSTEDEEGDTRSQQSTSPSAASTNDGNLAFALRFLRTARENRSLKFDLGARTRDKKIQAFFRVGAYFRYDLDDDWWGTINNNAVYFSEAGFEDTLTFKVERYIDRKDEILFLSSSQFFWEENQKGAAIGQTFGLYREIDSSRSIAVETLTGVITAPDSGEHRYRGTEFRVRYRQQVGREWFFIEIWPSVSWPSDREYKTTYGGLIRLEAIFGLRSD